MSLIDTIKSLLVEGKEEEARLSFLHELYDVEALLAWRSLAVNPLRSFSLMSFVQDVRFSSDVHSACICLDTGLMEIGTSFFIETMNSWADVFFVLLHERGHVLIGRLYGYSTRSFKDPKFANLWEDLYINSLVRRTIKTSFPASFYKDDDSIFSLLLQQKNAEWYAAQANILFFRLPTTVWDSLHPLSMGLLSEKIGYTTWMTIGLSMEDDLGVMMPPSDALPSPILEGNSERKRAEEKGKKEAETEGVVSEGVESSILKTFEVEELPFSCAFVPVDFETRATQFVTDEFLDDLIVARQLEEEPFEDTSTTIECLSSKDAFSLAAGHIPSMWTSEYEPPEREKLKLYMDVSGSMQKYWPLVGILSTQLSDYCDKYYQFSTKVVESDPGSSKINTTSGTSYDSVAEHILRNSYSNVIVVTDNTDNIEERLQEKLHNCLEFLCLIQTPGNHFKTQDFRLFADQVSTLFHLEECF